MSGAEAMSDTVDVVAHIGVKGGIGAAGAALQGMVLTYRQGDVEVGREEQGNIREGMTNNAAEIEAIVVALHMIDRPVTKAVVFTDIDWIANRLNIYLPKWSSEGGVPSKDKFRGEWMLVLEEAREKGIELEGVHVGKNVTHELVTRAAALANAALPPDPTKWTPEQRREGQARGARVRAAKKAAREKAIDRQVRAAVERDTL